MKNQTPQGRCRNALQQHTIKGFVAGIFPCQLKPIVLEAILHRILGIGEILWDMLPTGPQLGGAPANYSVMAARLGSHAAILSRLGDDPLGQQARETLDRFPVDVSLLQTDTRHPTGRVTVELTDGQPSYVIHQPVAWDFLEPSQSWLHLARSADAICFGTLAQRSAASRAAIHAVVGATTSQCHRIFDVNLRAPFYSAEILRESLQLATVVKMNDAEVPLVLKLLNLSVGAPEHLLRLGAEQILDAFPALRLVAITCGGDGSLLVTHTESHRHPGVPVRVLDTIGAGDAFTAAMTHYLLRAAPLSVLNEAGNRWGSFIASQAGAMPEIPPDTLARIQAEIET